MTTNAQSSGRVRFDHIEIDLRSGEVWKNGKKIRLQEQPFHVLRVLLEHPGEIVSRDELKQAIWPADTFVGFDDGLNTAVKKIRDVLGDSSDKPRYIETIPRRGYRFLATVTGVPTVVPVTDQNPTAGRERTETFSRTPDVLLQSATKSPTRKLRAVAFGIVVFALLAFSWVWSRTNIPNHAAQPVIKSLAVLPLKNLSGDATQEYLADGMTETLITDLAQISSLRVISRQSTMQYKNASNPLPVIAQELNVDAVVEGSVQRSGNRVRVSAQLIEGTTDRHLWAETFERDFSDVLSLQSDFARAIADRVHVQLTTQERQQLARTRPVKPEAHEAYLKGLYFWNRRMTDKAAGYFQQAIDLDSGYAQAYAGLARCYVLGGPGDLPVRESMLRARAAATKALEIDDTLAEAHAPLAYVKLFLDWDWRGAEAEFKRALDLNPNYATAHQWYANVLSLTGRYEEAFEEDRRAQALDPFSPVLYTHAGNMYSFARRYDRATEQYRKALDLDPSEVPAREGLVNIYELEGLYEEALSERERITVLSGGKLQDVAPLRNAYTRRGPGGYWQKRLESELVDGNQWPAEIAGLYARLGQDEKAFHWLNKAYDQRDYELLFVKNDPIYDHLRPDPRFQNLLRQTGLP